MLGSATADTSATTRGGADAPVVTAGATTRAHPAAASLAVSPALGGAGRRAVLTPRAAPRDTVPVRMGGGSPHRVTHRIELEMLMPGDPYKVLQIDPEAEPEVVRAAYRALALKYHPDVATGSQDRMAALNQAWGILRDPDARAAHDKARAQAKSKPSAPKPAVSYEMPAPTPPAPPGSPSGSVLDFGRYSGWSLGQIAGCDPDYLEWLARTPIGRAFNREIDGLLSTRSAAQAASAAAAASVATAERRSRRFRGS